MGLPSPPRAAALAEFERYLRDVAKVPGTPPNLDGVLFVLIELRGDSLCRPSDRDGLHPFVVPLTRAADGTVTGLLRWPTPPPDMEMPVVRCRPNDLGVELLANSCTLFVTRALVSADSSGQSDVTAAIRNACSLAQGYVDGEVDKLGVGVERYLLMKVAPFPDVYEGLARFHLAKGDEKSCLVTCERAATVFPGWGRAQVFHADVLVEIGRAPEARDAARFGLQMPLWTLGGRDAVMRLGRTAGYEDEDSLGKIYDRLATDQREKEIDEGKNPAQVALDRAAYLLDSVVAQGEATAWDADVSEKLAELYIAGGLEDVATFVRY
jgi:hypothetical protein